MIKKNIFHKHRLLYNVSLITNNYSTALPECFYIYFIPIAQQNKNTNENNAKKQINLLHCKVL